jgi:hypothetical protein
MFTAAEGGRHSGLHRGNARACPDTRYKGCDPAGGSSDRSQDGILGLRHEIPSSSLASSSSSSSSSAPLPPSPSPQSPPLSLSSDFAETQWPARFRQPRWESCARDVKPTRSARPVPCPARDEGSRAAGNPGGCPVGSFDGRRARSSRIARPRRLTSRQNGPIGPLWRPIGLR